MAQYKKKQEIATDFLKKYIIYDLPEVDYKCDRKKSRNPSAIKEKSDEEQVNNQKIIP